MERMQRGDSNPWTQRVSGNVPDGNGEGHYGKVYGAPNEPWGKQHLTQEKRTSQPVQCLLFPHAPCTPPSSSLAPGAVPTCQRCSAEISAFPTSYVSNDVPTYSCRDQLPTPVLTPAISFPRRVLWPLHWKPLFHPYRLPTSSSAALGLSRVLSVRFTCVVLCP